MDTVEQWCHCGETSSEALLEVVMAEPQKLTVWIKTGFTFNQPGSKFSYHEYYGVPWYLWGSYHGLTCPDKMASPNGACARLGRSYIVRS